MRYHAMWHGGASIQRNIIGGMYVPELLSVPDPHISSPVLLQKSITCRYLPWQISIIGGYMLQWNSNHERKLLEKES